MKAKQTVTKASELQERHADLLELFGETPGVIDLLQVYSRFQDRIGHFDRYLEGGQRQTVSYGSDTAQS